MPSVCPRLACCPPMPALQLAGWALGKVIGKNSSSNEEVQGRRHAAPTLACTRGKHGSVCLHATPCPAHGVAGSAQSQDSDETSSVTRHRVDWSYLVVQETLQICWAVSQEVAHRAGLWPSRDQDSASQRQVGAGDTMGALFERVRNSLGARAD